MPVNRATPDAASAIGQIEQALSRIVSWATRNDVQQEIMRRAKCELPRRHVWLLGRLNTLGTARLSDLALSLGVDNSTLTPQAKRLEREGLIGRDVHPSDGRASLLHVTRAGKALLIRLHATRRAMFAELLSDWPATDQERAGLVLIELAQLLEASTEPAADTAPRH